MAYDRGVGHYVGNNLCLEGAVNLMSAVMEKAKSDYIYGGSQERSAINRFVHSEHGKLFYGGADVDPDSIIANWKIQKEHEDWRLAHGCSGCVLKKSKAKDRQACIHENPGHYTYERVCIIEESFKNGFKGTDICRTDDNNTDVEEGN